MSRFLERRFSVPGPGSTRDAANCSHTWVGRQKEQLSFITREPTPDEELLYRAGLSPFHKEIDIAVKEPIRETVGVCMFCGAQVRKVGESWERV